VRPRQHKDYVLTLLFMKYVSDKAAGARGSLIEVPKRASFADMVALKGDKEIGDKINKIIARLAAANDLKGVIDQADFNDEGKLGSGKEMQDRLSRLVAIFDGLDFRANRAEGDDLLGDAYEYLMRHFATESGKSKGQFYTPAEVSRIMAQVIGINQAGGLREPTVYDPTCGSGSRRRPPTAGLPDAITADLKVRTTSDPLEPGDVLDGFENVGGLREDGFFELGGVGDRSIQRPDAPDRRVEIRE